MTTSILLIDQGSEGHLSDARYPFLDRRQLRLDGVRRRGAPRRRARLADVGDDSDARGAGPREPAIPRLLPAAAGRRESAS